MSGPYEYEIFENEPIDSTGEIANTNIIGTLVSVNIQGTATADYALDVSPNGDDWFEGEATYSGTDIRDTFELPDRHVRIRVTSAATSNETATVTIQGVEN